MLHETNENSTPKVASLTLENCALEDAVLHAVETIARAASKHALEAYLVGGMVRDIVAGFPSITTSPDVTVIDDAAMFAQAMTVENADCSLISASQHHTAKVEIGSVTVDIASARSDIYKPWGSLPQITLVKDIESDLQRRDFTANAMAIHLTPSGLGDLIDPLDGCTDVANRIMRVIREESFAEDPLRMLRGVRLAARYGYIFDDDTANSIRGSLDHLSKMCDASPQRVFNEFRLWFRPHEDLDALTAMAAQNGMLNILVPDANFRDGAFRQSPPVATELERFAAFAYLAPMDVMTDLAMRLRMPSDWRAIVSDTDIARDIAEKFHSELVTEVELRHSLIDVRDEVIRAVICVETVRDISKRFIDFRDRLRTMRTALNGGDLIVLGVAQGPMIGDLLEELLVLRIEGAIATADEERAYVIRRLDDG